MKSKFTNTEWDTIIKVVKNCIQQYPTNLQRAFNEASINLKHQHIEISPKTIENNYYNKKGKFYRNGKVLGICFTIIANNNIITNCKNTIYE